MRRGRPLISALQEPHLAALQFQRQARWFAEFVCLQWTASSTTMPSTTGTSKRCSAPESASPRKICKTIGLVDAAGFGIFELMSEPARASVGSRLAGARCGARPRLELDLAAIFVGDKVHAAERRVLLQVVKPPVRAAALAPLDGRTHDGFGDHPHESEIPGRVPTRVVLPRAGHVDPGRTLAQLQDSIKADLQ